METVTGHTEEKVTNETLLQKCEITHESEFKALVETPG